MLGDIWDLPAKMSKRHVPFGALMAPVDYVFCDPDVVGRRDSIHKVIVSNNGSVLDEVTFSSTSLIYLISQLNYVCPIFPCCRSKRVQNM